MIKLNNEGKLFTLIREGLLETITEHGVIHRGLVKSATKRILGKIKTDVYQSKAYNLKRIRNNDGYVWVDAKTNKPATEKHGGE